MCYFRVLKVDRRRGLLIDCWLEYNLASAGCWICWNRSLKCVVVGCFLFHSAYWFCMHDPSGHGARKTEEVASKKAMERRYTGNSFVEMHSRPIGTDKHIRFYCTRQPSDTWGCEIRLYTSTFKADKFQI